MGDSRFKEKIPGRYPVPGISNWFKTLGVASKFPNSRPKRCLYGEISNDVFKRSLSGCKPYVSCFTGYRGYFGLFFRKRFKSLGLLIPGRGYLPGIDGYFSGIEACGG
jgi:hypothetical protein